MKLILFITLLVLILALPQANANVCCAYTNDINCTGDVWCVSGNSCGSLRKCADTCSSCCSADSDCPTCGSGDCAGNLECDISSGRCQSTCNSEGNSCSLSKPCNPYCSGKKYCTYPANPATCSGTCSSSGACQCTPDCGSATCSCIAAECNAECSAGDTASCSYCSSESCPAGGTKFCTGTKSCQSDCTWGSCSGVTCSCVAGKCGVPTATTPQQCSGSISLSLSPNPASPSVSITATTSGLSNCDGKTVKVYLHTERGDALACSCLVSGSGCSCTFNAPSNTGTYTYRSTLDVNGDGVYDIYGDATLTVTTSICSTRCKDSSTVEYYCGSGSGCGWKPYICDLAFCDSSVGKCTCTQQYCDNLPLGGLGYKRGPKCVSYEKTDSCNIGGCSESSSCNVSEKACGCDSIADCCSQAATNSYVRGKCMQCVSSSKTCDLVDTNSCPQYYSLCCKFDSDCPAKNNIKGKCDSPSGTGHVSGSYTYTCVWPPCSKNDECVDNSCCTADPTLPAECKDISGVCVNQGNLRCNNKYLCDPPEWHVDTQTKTQNIFEVILDFFSHFFQR